MTTWQTTSHLPNDEPNEHNQTAYARAQLMAGASPDARYIYDVVYEKDEACFVLTLLEINEEWGFVEQQYRLYPKTRDALLQSIAHFETEPDKVLNQLNIQAA
ncbi:hypothetical protein ACKLNO_02210 [Neisseriaceae bacterium B1]